jgi:tRNA-specific 2-thiouridylase
MPDRVAVAMSGGVDSTVAAAMLVEAGYDVVGVMMRLWGEEENLCCSPEAVEEARRAASQLGIPFLLLDYEDEFRRHVVEPFVAEYSRGRTPNPCLACNRHIRFGRLLDEVGDLGATKMATGHYARVDSRAGRYRLRMGCDPKKDQSYVLYMLGQRELERLMFPVGCCTKRQVREMARERGLAAADRDESMDLCFVTDGDYGRFLQEHAPETVLPGPILDSAGNRLGRHRGLALYTVGQRRGIGIASSEALYVLRLDVANNALIVGAAHELGRSDLMAEDVRYPAGFAPDGPTRVRAKIRYRALLADAMWIPLEDGRARVEFDAGLRDITPGQAVVAYRGDVVFGGGTISE